MLQQAVEVTLDWMETSAEHNMSCDRSNLHIFQTDGEFQSRLSVEKKTLLMTIVIFPLMLLLVLILRL